MTIWLSKSEKTKNFPKFSENLDSINANFSNLGAKIMVHMHLSMIQFEKAIEFLSKENIKVSIMTYLREIMTSSWRHNIQTLRYYICFDVSESGLVWGGRVLFE